MKKLKDILTRLFTACLVLVFVSMWSSFPLTAEQINLTKTQGQLSTNLMESLQTSQKLLEQQEQIIQLLKKSSTNSKQYIEQLQSQRTTLTNQVVTLQRQVQTLTEQSINWGTKYREATNSLEDLNNQIKTLQNQIDNVLNNTVPSLKEQILAQENEIKKQKIEKWIAIIGGAAVAGLGVWGGIQLGSR